MQCKIQLCVTRPLTRVILYTERNEVPPRNPKAIHILTGAKRDLTFGAVR